MLHWLDHNAAAVQALASIATALVTVVLAWITRKYVLLTQELAVAAREQLRFQQHSERSDAAELLTLIEMFLGNLARLPLKEERANRLSAVSIWKHSDESKFASLAAAVLGASSDVDNAVQALSAIRAVIDGLRQLPPGQDGGFSFSWAQWPNEVTHARTALRSVRNKAEEAEISLAHRVEQAGTLSAPAPVPVAGRVR